MKVKYDQKVDVLRIRFSSAEVNESLPIFRARVGALALRSRGQRTKSLVPFDDEAKERVHKLRDRKTLIVPSLKKFTIKPGFDLRFTHQNAHSKNRFRRTERR